MKKATIKTLRNAIGHTNRLLNVFNGVGFIPKSMIKILAPLIGGHISLWKSMTDFYLGSTYENHRFLQDIFDIMKKATIKTLRHAIAHTNRLLNVFHGVGLIPKSMFKNLDPIIGWHISLWKSMTDFYLGSTMETIVFCEQNSISWKKRP